MARIILITGGGRSGKSAYAQKLGEASPQPRAYVATCPVIDEEMRRRIEKHRKMRRDDAWRTVEEATDLGGVLGRLRDSRTILVECLTLWINNLMYEAQRSGRELDEEEMAAQCANVLAACREHPGCIIFVTNEVGLGIVPENEVSRRYRDLVGRCNQIIAAQADVVTLVSCGIPLTLKGCNHESIS